MQGKDLAGKSKHYFTRLQVKCFQSAVDMNIATDTKPNAEKLRFDGPDCRFETGRRIKTKAAANQLVCIIQAKLTDANPFFMYRIKRRVKFIAGYIAGSWFHVCSNKDKKKKADAKED